MDALITTGLCGVGVGWRPELEDVIDRAELRFVETVAENVGVRRVPRALLAAREHGLQVIPHGIGLSLGGALRPERHRLDHLAALDAGRGAARDGPRSRRRAPSPAGSDARSCPRPGSSSRCASPATARACSRCR